MTHTNKHYIGHHINKAKQEFDDYVKRVEKKRKERKSIIADKFKEVEDV